MVAVPAEKTLKRCRVAAGAARAAAVLPASAHHGVAERGAGGGILYLMLGVRAYWENVSFALGVKLPTWTDLNEEDEQRGAEGKERYRVIYSVSALF